MAKFVPGSTQAPALAALAAGPLTSRELGERIGITDRAMNKALTRYAAKGLVVMRGFRRMAHPMADGRRAATVRYPVLWALPDAS